MLTDQLPPPTHLSNFRGCFKTDSCDDEALPCLKYSGCFHVIDQAGPTFRLKIKETLHILLENLSLNQQLQRFLLLFFFMRTH